MTEPTKLFSAFGLDYYAYGLCGVAAIVLGIILTAILLKMKQRKMHESVTLAIFALVIGFAFSHLVYCLVRWNFVAVDFKPGFFFDFNLGGHSMAGAVTGVLLAVALYCKLTRCSLRQTLDAMAPGALLAVGVMRAAEAFTTEGVGYFVDMEELWFFPFAVQNLYGEYVAPVFFYEAVTALAICAVTLALVRGARHADGYAAMVGLLFLALTQIFWESLREDEFLRFGFVRFNQLCGLAVVVVIIVQNLMRVKKNPAYYAGIGLCVLAASAVLVFVEFGLDKSRVSNSLLYAAMLAALAALAVLTLRIYQQPKALASDTK